MGSAGAGASSVFIRAAIASGFGRRLRRAGRFFRSPSTSASPVSVEYVVPSPSSPVAASRSGIWRRASAITSEIAVEQQLLLLGVICEVAVRRALLQVLQALDLLLDRLEVRQRPAEPALRYVERAAALRLRFQNALELLLRADEQHALTLQDDAAQQLLCDLELTQRLLKIDDVDAGAFGDDEPPHLRIPAASLMAELDTCFQQFLQLRLSHAIPFLGLFPPPPSSLVQPRRDPGRDRAT